MGWFLLLTTRILTKTKWGGHKTIIWLSPGLCLSHPVQNTQPHWLVLILNEWLSVPVSFHAAQQSSFTSLISSVSHCLSSLHTLKPSHISSTWAVNLACFITEKTETIIRGLLYIITISTYTASFLPQRLLLPNLLCQPLFYKPLYLCCPTLATSPHGYRALEMWLL